MKATKKQHVQQLLNLGVCNEAVEYAAQFSSLQEAWNVCGRGDWMLWFARKMSRNRGLKERKTLILAACKCARTALKYVPKREKRLRLAIECAEAWARNGKNITLEDVQRAADAAYVVAYAAADVASAAAYAAASTASATDAAYAAKKVSLKHCADIVREFYPKAPKLLVEKQNER